MLVLECLFISLWQAECDYARKNKANYLLNIALRKDGAIHSADQSTLQGFADLKD